MTTEQVMGLHWVLETAMNALDTESDRMGSG